MIRETRAELYPLTAHGLDHREFMRRWNAVRAYFTDEHLSSSSEPVLRGYPEHIDFGGALQAVKAGHHVARAGWQGAARYVTLQDGYPDGIGVNENTAAATGLPKGHLAAFSPYLTMCIRAHRSLGVAAEWELIDTFVPWTPDMTDVLAEDWTVVPRPDAPADDPDEDVTTFGAPPRRPR